MKAMLDQFDRVHVINLADRTDRRREITAQLRRVGAADDPRTIFYPARRPADAGPFPSIGARGCYESHLGVIRQAVADGIQRLLILEDDFDFAHDGLSRGSRVMAALASTPWDICYGAGVFHGEDGRKVHPDEHGLAVVAPGIAIETASFVAMSSQALALLEPFLLAILDRPAGSPEYGPMHVDGAYSIFRRQHPAIRTLVCQPALGAQRASRSDISTHSILLDRHPLGRPVANVLRRLLSRRGRR